MSNANEACSDEEELDKMRQSLVDLSKSVASYEDHYKFKFNPTFSDEIENLKANIEKLTTIVSNYFPLVSNFDYKDVRYNGYRSLFRIIGKCVDNLSESLKKSNFTSLTFNREKNEKQIRDYMQCLLQLTKMSSQFNKMMIIQKDVKKLFLFEEDNEEVYSNLLKYFEAFESNAFYGQCLGFYLCQPCQMLAKVFCSIQLGLGQALYLPKSNLEIIVSTLVNSVQSWWMEEKRSQQISDLYRQASVSFCKQFWNLVDHPAVVSWSRVTLPNMSVVKEITLEPTALMVPHAIRDEDVMVAPPGFQTENEGKVKIRLLSKYRRKGMEWLRIGSKEEFRDPSPCLLFHCHGGGFVAQSSQSHDGYLRQWAIDLTYPVVSVDYSHAPEFPYPRAHEECLYAYAWTLMNLGKLGCSPDCRIVMCGDSAGGNLVLGCVLKALTLNIRVPDGIFLAYPATLINFVPSPARIIGAFCPILPIGIIARCLLAYSGKNEEDLVKEQSYVSTTDQETSKPHSDKFLDRDTLDSAGKKMFYSKENKISPIKLLLRAEIESDPFMSPFSADEELLKRLPPMSIFASEFDPLLDDSVEFCKKVSNAGAQKVRLKVMKDLPHGFLNMATPVTKECSNATRSSMEEIKRLFQLV